jgi:hypothetical protein
MSSSTASISASAFCFRSPSKEAERDQMMNSIAPFWDGNETWLVLGGGGLWVAFPAGLCGHHAGALSAGDHDAAGAGLPRRRVRIPLVAQDVEGLWNFAFAAARLLARFRRASCWAAAAGDQVQNGQFAGGPFDWARRSRFCAASASSRLRAAWRDLADHADRGNGGGARARSGQGAAAGVLVPWRR